ncbi:MAG TPA: NAD(P)/FAD-dependent oxidoreductase [Terriglobales bacterium]|nr:NAD(P)/FAD-dependent oxidoreductase [Terriglobales bacterium]
MDEIETVVIGAGVVGLAIARALAQAGQEVLVLEEAAIIGSGTSSRNSEVIHAGLYYPTGSLKAALCVAGRDQLYAFCAEHGVEHQRLGKLIVAADQAQESDLAAIAGQAAANGVNDLRRLTAADIKSLEPNLQATAGLFSPSTGIIDSHGYMLALQGDAEAAGAAIAFHAPVESGGITPQGFDLSVGGDAAMQLRARRLVNAAGHGAWQIARKLEGYPANLIPEQALAKGSYFTLRGRSPFSHLVYPVPEPGGLGIHLTLDLAGVARFGPDVEWVEQLDYEIDPGRAARFYPAIRRYWPGLPEGALEPAYTGIRPKLGRPTNGAPDFRIDSRELHGIPGLVQLFGIESPGLTASLAIAALVADRL